jgi:4-oxalocrotonate tautomerase
MPSLTIAYSTPLAPSPTRKGEVARLLTELTERHLGKARPLTAVTVAEIAAEDWFVGGRSLADLGQASHHVVVRVTEGTNTKAEKARFLAAVHDGLAHLLGRSRPESYVIVEEVRADAWGYGGETQEYRTVAAKLADESAASQVFDAYRRFGVR